jgi:putative hemin transport protein
MDTTYKQSEPTHGEVTTSADDKGATAWDSEQIRVKFAEARALGKRAKDAAESIGVSEGQAIASHQGLHSHAPKAHAVMSDWLTLLTALEPCGPLLALTRNHSVVHEKTGVYRNLSGQGAMGMALGEEIDLRLFFGQWAYGFAVTELAANPANRPAYSLQFFDSTGLAVHKIFVRPATNIERWNALIEKHTTEHVVPATFTSRPAPVIARLDDEVDISLLWQDWSQMRDTHEFFGLLRKHHVERQQSFRLVRGQYTYELRTSAIHDLLMSASFTGVPIMCFVSSPGCIQIHTGPVKRIEPMNIRGTQWLNVIDPDFNLHLDEGAIANVWLVEKPTADGLVTSVEAFDHNGDLMVMFFGARNPGKPELKAWRMMALELEQLSQTEAI